MRLHMGDKTMTDLSKTAEGCSLLEVRESTLGADMDACRAWKEERLKPLTDTQGVSNKRGLAFHDVWG